MNGSLIRERRNALLPSFLMGSTPAPQSLAVGVINSNIAYSLAVSNEINGLVPPPPISPFSQPPRPNSPQTRAAPGERRRREPSPKFQTYHDFRLSGRKCRGGPTGARPKARRRAPLAGACGPVAAKASASPNWPRLADGVPFRRGRRNSPSISWARKFRLKRAVKGAPIARAASDGRDPVCRTCPTVWR
jgi:hypothetical protein